MSNRAWAWRLTVSLVALLTGVLVLPGPVQATLLGAALIGLGVLFWPTGGGESDG